MTTVKIAVTLPEEEVDRARQAVAEGRARSVSAYVADALVRGGRANELAELVADLKRESGEPSPDDYAWADRVLGRAS